MDGIKASEMEIGQWGMVKYIGQDPLKGQMVYVKRGLKGFYIVPVGASEAYYIHNADVDNVIGKVKLDVPNFKVLSLNLIVHNTPLDLFTIIEGGSSVDKRTVTVKFKGSSNTYHFFAVMPIKVGDKVIVDTSRGLNEATVTNVHSKGYVSSNATKWVVKNLTQTSQPDSSNADMVYVSVDQITAQIAQYEDELFAINDALGTRSNRTQYDWVTELNNRKMQLSSKIASLEQYKRPHYMVPRELMGRVES